MVPYRIVMFYTSKLLDYSTVNITDKPCDTWRDKYTDAPFVTTSFRQYLLLTKRCCMFRPLQKAIVRHKL